MLFIPVVCVWYTLSQVWTKIYRRGLLQDERQSGVSFGKPNIPSFISHLALISLRWQWKTNNIAFLPKLDRIIPDIKSIIC